MEFKVQSVTKSFVSSTIYFDFHIKFRAKLN